MRPVKVTELSSVGRM